MTYLRVLSNLANTVDSIHYRSRHQRADAAGICGRYMSASIPASLVAHASFSEIQAKALGMKVEVFGPLGDNIEHTGQPGELVCTRPHPSIPVRFWGDDDKGTKFLKAYYDVYPGT